MARRDTLLGIGGAALAGGAAAAAGAVVDRARRLRERVPGLDEGFGHVPDEVLVVPADDGLELHVEIDAGAPGAADDTPGRRPTVVFTHGFTLSSRSWVLQRRALSLAGFRVVAWDQRGHGSSGRPDPESCTLTQLGRDLAAVIEATAPEGPLVLVGHSMGGMTVMSYGRQHPGIVTERVIAVALVATSAGGGGLTNLGFGSYAGSFVGRLGPGVLNSLGRHDEIVRAFRRFGRPIEDATVARYSFDSPVPAELVRFAGDLIMSTPLDVVADFLPLVESVAEIPSLAAFRGLEALVLNGEGDILTPPEHSESIVQAIPGAEHVVLEDAGHLVMLEHPQVVTEQLLLLIERARRAFAEGIPAAAKPRVRRRITDIATRQTVARVRAARSRSRQRPDESGDPATGSRPGRAELSAAAERAVRDGVAAPESDDAAGRSARGAGTSTGTRRPRAGGRRSAS